MSLKSKSQGSVSGAMLSWALCAPLLGCTGNPFETPSAFESQEYVCESGDLRLPYLVEECEAMNADGQRCGGVFSLRGEVGLTPLTATLILDETSFGVVRKADVAYFDRADAVGDMPYAEVALKIKSLGGPAQTEVFDERRRLEYGFGTSDDEFEDATASLALRFSTPAESESLESQAGSGELLIAEQSLDRLVGSFEASIGDSANEVEGCFHLISNEVRTMRQLP